MLSKRPITADPTNQATWSPAVLKGALVVPASAEVRIEMGNYARTCPCVGLAEDGFVISTDRPLPLRQLLRCKLRVGATDEMELFAFAAADAAGDRQEIKPMGLSGDMAERWFSLRQTESPAVRARGTGPTRPLKTGVYVSIQRSRSDWFWRLLQRLR